MTRRAVLGGVAAAALGLTAAAVGAGRRNRRSGSRTVSLGFDDVLAAAADPGPVRARLAELGADVVAVTAGRTDWTTFRWAGRPDTWSAQIAKREWDPFADVVRTVAEGRRVIAVIDVLAERLLRERPELATADARGQASPLRPSTTALVSGEVGDRLVAMTDYLLTTYRVDGINLTELDFYEFGYSDDELSAYRSATGESDWPRRSDGRVDIDAPSIGTWRSGQVAAVVRRVAEVTRKHGAELLVDVRLSWPDLSRRGREFGQDYSMLLTVADRLVLWYLPGLPGHPDRVDRLIESLGDQRRADYVLSVGLWSETGASVPDRLAESVRAAERAELGGTWITPYGLLDTRTTEALRRAWA